MYVSIQYKKHIKKEVLEQYGLYQEKGQVCGLFEDIEECAKSSNKDIKSIGMKYINGQYDTRYNC